MKIDQVEAQYEIPGFEIAPNALEHDEAEDGVADYPFQLGSPSSRIPPPANWQELLGLTTVAPSAISIDPPTREVFRAARFRSIADYSPQGDAIAANTELPSITVRRMLALMAQTRETVERIRNRSREVL